MSLAIKFKSRSQFQEERISDTGDEADIRDSTLSVHASFLIKAMSQREEHVRDISVNLLIQLRDKFPQVIFIILCISLPYNRGEPFALIFLQVKP